MDMLRRLINYCIIIIIIIIIIINLLVSKCYVAAAEISTHFSIPPSCTSFSEAD